MSKFITIMGSTVKKNDVKRIEKCIHSPCLNVYVTGRKEPIMVNDGRTSEDIIKEVEA